jgi:hypothetical protein
MPPVLDMLGGETRLIGTGAGRGNNRGHMVRALPRRLRHELVRYPSRKIENVRAARCDKTHVLFLFFPSPLLCSNDTWLASSTRHMYSTWQ